MATGFGTTFSRRMTLSEKRSAAKHGKWGCAHDRYYGFTITTPITVNSDVGCCTFAATTAEVLANEPVTVSGGGD